MNVIRWHSCVRDEYLLLTESEGRTVSYDLRTEFFFPSIYGLSAKRAGHYSKGSTVCLTGSGTISIHAERLQISDAPRKQNRSI